MRDEDVLVKRKENAINTHLSIYKVIINCIFMINLVY